MFNRAGIWEGKKKKKKRNNKKDRHMLTSVKAIIIFGEDKKKDFANHVGCSESAGSLNFCRASSTHNSKRSSPASTRRTGTVLARPFDTRGGGCCGSPFLNLETEYGAVHERRWTLPGSATIQVCSSLVVPAGGRASSRTSMHTVKLNSSSRGNGVNRAQAEANRARHARN